MIIPSLLLALLADCHSGPLRVMLHSVLGSLSHIKPLLEIGLVLQKRNHTVVFAASDMNERFNKPYGFSFVSLGKSSFFADSMWYWFRETFDKRQRVDTNLPPDTLYGLLSSSYEDVYPRLNKVVEEMKLDVIVYDFFSPACRDVAEMNGIPVITGFQAIDGVGLFNPPFLSG